MPTVQAGANPRLEPPEDLEQVAHRRAFAVVLVDPQVAHDAPLVDHKSRRMRDLTSAAVSVVEDSVLSNRIGARIHQEREVSSLCVTKLAQLVRFVMSDSPDNGVGHPNGIDGVLQLAELRAAVGSPGAPKKDQNDVLFTLEIAELQRISVNGLQNDFRGLRADLRGGLHLD